jgi:hypothetical protein
MGDRARRRAQAEADSTKRRFARVVAAVAGVLAVSSGIAAILLATPWWIPTLTISAAMSFGGLAFRGYDLGSAKVLLGGLAVTGILALAARGAWDLRPFAGYAGEFVVVDFVVFPGVVPMEDAIGPDGLSYSKGHIVIVDCKTHGIKAPREVWYRVKGEHVFLNSSSVAASCADPPGTPPDC